MTEHNTLNSNTREPLFVDIFTNESPSDRIVIYKDDSHERKREHFYWESCMDKKGNTLPSPIYIKLKDLDLAHLERLCYFTLKGFPPYVNKLMVDEWNYRVDEGDSIVRKCFSCHGDGTEEISFQDDNEPLDDKLLVSGIVTPCWYCNGKGEVEDGCCCVAPCSCECICGAWDDHKCDCWEG